MIANRRFGGPLLWRVIGGVALGMALASPAAAQTFTHRGFIDGRGTFYAQPADNDETQAVGDAIWREELFFKPAPWIQFAGGIDARANSHDQVDASWRLDTRDRGVLRPALSLRRLSATLTKRALTLDIGKQFIRWGKADIVTPTDRFAPRDFLNVVENEFLPVTGVRAVAEFAEHRLELAVVPWLTPSRIPLVDQRWSGVPSEIVATDPETGLPVVVPVGTLTDVSGPIADHVQGGIRWGYTRAGYELSLSFFDGNNTYPNIPVTSGALPGDIDFARVYPTLRSYGGDIAVPLSWFTVKGEAAWFTTTTEDTEEYVLYVVQLERQSGEWTLLGGYVGEAVTERGSVRSFAPDRGLARSLVARVSRTIDTNRSASVETAIGQNGAGAYLKGEYSQAQGAHWRLTVSGAWLGGDQDDFIGQYNKNSHVIAALRYSY